MGKLHIFYRLSDLPPIGQAKVLKALSNPIQTSTSRIMPDQNGPDLGATPACEDSLVDLLTTGHLLTASAGCDENGERLDDIVDLEPLSTSFFTRGGALQLGRDERSVERPGQFGPGFLGLLASDIIVVSRNGAVDFKISLLVPAEVSELEYEQQREITNTEPPGGSSSRKRLRNIAHKLNSWRAKLSKKPSTSTTGGGYREENQTIARCETEQALLARQAPKLLTLKNDMPLSQLIRDNSKETAAILTAGDLPGSSADLTGGEVELEGTVSAGWTEGDDLYELCDPRWRHRAGSSGTGIPASARANESGLHSSCPSGSSS